MLDRKTYMSVSATIFSIVALVHLLRLINGWDLVVGGWAVPQVFTVIAIILAGTLAYTGFSKR